MHVRGLEFDIAWEDKPESQSRMDELLAGSPPPPGSLILTPELGDVGFSRNLNNIIDGQSLEWAAATARKYSCWVQHGWAEWADDGTRGLNTTGILDPDGELMGRYHKTFPFAFAREHEAYDSGNTIHLFDLEGTIVCPFICYDLRFPELWRLATRAGAELFTIGASWPAARTHHWQALAMARAIENQAFVVAINRTGEDPFVPYAGGSMIVSPMGDILASGDDSSRMLSAEVDPEVARAWRGDFPCLDDIKPDLLGSISIIRH